MNAESALKKPGLKKPGLKKPGLKKPGLKKPWLRAGLGERVNPIVIKELRQAVQSRFVVAALLTLLSIQIVAIGIYLLASGSSLINFDAGRQVFLMLFAILQVIGALFVPIYTAVRLAAERSDTNMDLLFITTIKPRSIITGKMVAAVALTGLIYSACMPFMAFTYFLRGIDLPSIFFSLGIGFAVVVLCAQVAIFVACVPVNRAFKVIFGLITLIIFGFVYFTTMAGVSGVVTHGIESREFWNITLSVVSAVALLLGLFFAMSIALIMPLAANRAAPVRAFLASAWALLGAAALIDAKIEKSHAAVILWTVVFEVIFAIAIFAAVSERDRPGRRVLRSIPASLPKRLLSFFFFSGAANGVAWTTVMCALTLGVAWGSAKLFPGRGETADLVDSAKWVGGMSLYFFCYALTGALLRRRLLSGVSSELTWLIGAILLGLGSVVPVLIGYIAFSDDKPWSGEFGAWLVGNPFAWGNKGHRVLYASVAGVWAALVAAANAPWFLDRVKGFKPAAKEGANDAFEPSAQALASGASTTTD